MRLHLLSIPVSMVLGQTLRSSIHMNSCIASLEHWETPSCNIDNHKHLPVLTASCVHTLEVHHCASSATETWSAGDSEEWCAGLGETHQPSLHTHKTTVPSLVWTTHSQLVHTPACNMQKSRGSLVINTSRLVGDHMALEKQF